MWSSSRLLKAVTLAAGLALGGALSGCSGFTPVYGEHGLTNQRIAIAYAAPGNRLEQIIYQQLALRLGSSTDPNAPVLEVKTSKTSGNLTSGDVTTAVRQKRLELSAKITLTGPDKTVLFTGTRMVTADYSTSPQVLANQSAQTTTEENAARQLAETIRLTILAALSTPVQ